MVLMDILFFYENSLIRTILFLRQGPPRGSEAYRASRTHRQDKTDKTDRPIQRIFSSDFLLSDESVHEKASMGSV